MRGENMAKNRPKCWQIAKIFVVVTSGNVYLWLWKSLENSANFFSYFVATLCMSTTVSLLVNSRCVNPNPNPQPKP